MSRHHHYLDARERFTYNNVAQSIDNTLEWRDLVLPFTILKFISCHAERECSGVSQALHWICEFMNTFMSDLFENLTTASVQELVGSPSLQLLLSVTADEKLALGQLNNTEGEMPLEIASTGDYALSDWFWTGNTQFRIHNFSVQSRKQYARVRLKTDVPSDQVPQYTALISCIVGTAGLNALLVSAFASGITIPVVLAIIAFVAIACFSENSIPYEAFKSTIKDAYVEKRWGKWG